MDPNSIFSTMTENRCKLHKQIIGEDKNLLNLTPNLTMHPAAQSRILDNNSTPSFRCFEAASAVGMAKNSSVDGSENDDGTAKTNFPVPTRSLKGKTGLQTNNKYRYLTYFQRGIRW